MLVPHRNVQAVQPGGAGPRAGCGFRTTGENLKIGIVATGKKGTLAAEKKIVNHGWLVNCSPLPTQLNGQASWLGHVRIDVQPGGSESKGIQQTLFVHMEGHVQGHQQRVAV